MSQDKADELMRRAMEKAAEMARIQSDHLRRWPTAANQYAAACREQMRRLHGGQHDQ